MPTESPAPTSSSCDACGNLLPDDRTEGLCPACLMMAALDPDDDPSMDESVSSDSNAQRASRDSLEGTTVAGRYKLLQRIGEGGFGVVYMAEQTTPVRRRVALKVLKAGMDTQQVVARFEAERQALAVMDHPNIARIHDGGETDNGRPFFVMELVRGIPITKFCAAEKLPLEQRLRLFNDVCRAVQHAHQKGIIHRDLKPGNILVTTPNGAEPVPKVIDFGVAKAVDTPLTDKTLFTRFEQMVGTPAYMSPEQAAATGQDIDTRADIYALGVLLYELLTGTTPFEADILQKAAFDEIRRILREEEPPKPSTRITLLRQRQKSAQGRHHERKRQGDIPKDLDWIAMKALEKDQRRRYDTANGLAKDVERFLENEPVSAGPPRIGYRLSKFYHRNRTATTVAVLVVVALLGGIMVATWGLMRAVAAEGKASLALENLESAYDSLSVANTTEQAARRDTQLQLVERLMEKGTSQWNTGECIGLATLQEAVHAAVGSPELEHKALEMWNLARTWLPGGIETIVDAPYAVALSHDESLLCWMDAHGLHIEKIDGGQRQSIHVEERLYDAQIPWKVLGFVFSHDDRMVSLHNAFNGIAQVFDAATLQPITGLLCHPDTGLDKSVHLQEGWEKVAFDPTGRFLATIAYNGSACLWDIGKGDLATSSWTIGVDITNLGFSPSGESLILSSVGIIRHVNLLDSQFSSLELLNNHEEGQVNELLVIDDSRLVTGVRNSVNIWNLETQEIMMNYRIPGPETPNYYLLEHIGLSPDGKVLAFGTRHGETALCNAETLEPHGQPLRHGGRGVRGLDYSADGSTLATGCINGTVQFWKPEEPRHHLGTWPQPHKVERVFTGNVGRRLLTAFSNCAVLRTFPQATDIPTTGPIPSEGDMMDITSDGENLLVRSHDKQSVAILSRSGNEFGSGPTIDPTEGQIMSARFSPDTQAIIYNTSIRGEGEDYRNWSIPEAAHLDFECEIPCKLKITETSLGAVLPTSPLSIVVESLAWEFKVIDLSTSEVVFDHWLTNQCACTAVNAVAGWYGVGDKSGIFRRFRIEGHEEIFPQYELDGSLLFAACSGDGEWLITVETNQEGSRTLRAWLVADQSSLYSLKRPFPHEGGRIFPVGERGFVFQSGQELRRFDLPEVMVTADKVASLTEASLGVKRHERDRTRFQMLTDEEFQAARELNRDH